MSSDEECSPRKRRRSSEASHSSSLSAEEDFNTEENTCGLDECYSKESSDCFSRITSVLDKGLNDELELVKASVSQDVRFDSNSFKSMEVPNDGNLQTGNSVQPNSSFISNQSLDLETHLLDHDTQNHNKLVDVMLMSEVIPQSLDLDTTNEDLNQQYKSNNLDCTKEGDKDSSFLKIDASPVLKLLNEEVEFTVLSIQNQISMVPADSLGGCDSSNNPVLHSSLTSDVLNSSFVSEGKLSIGVLDTSNEAIHNSDYASTPCKQATHASLSQPYHPFVSPIKFEEFGSSPNEHSTENDSESGSESDSQEASEGVDNNSDMEESALSETFFNVVVNQLQEETFLNETSASVSESVKTIAEKFLLNEIKLFNGSSKSVNEAILEIMTLYLQNKLTKAGLHRTIRSMCDLLPEDHKLPSSSFLVLSYVGSLAPPVSATIHYFCESCLYYHGSSIVGQCVICKDDTKFSRFYTFNLGVLIKYFFEERSLASLIDCETEKRKHRNPNNLTDLKDGTVYQRLNKFRGRYDLTFILSSDGLRIRKGKSELWLAMITIAEVPIHLQRSFLTVIGVWYHEKKPDMKTFLKPFVEEMESLDQNGIEWTHPTTGNVEKSCARLCVTVLDSPARAAVQNVMNFNSRYGCNICEIKTQKSQPVPLKKCVRIYHYVSNCTLRTKNRMLKQAETALEQGKEHVRGVKGPSILSLIPNVDPSECIVPEYMHSVLIGVVKQVVTFWTRSSKRGSIKERITAIDTHLSTFKHPDFVHRSTRQLRNLKHWKASDFYYFMFFEALPTLKGHLADDYLQHFMLLVKGIFTLLKSSIPRSEQDESDTLLKLFANEFMSLYGDRALTSNVHQLLHLVSCVKKYGPLFCWSAFPSEGLNSMVSDSTHGTYNIDAEIVNNVKLCQGIQMLQNIVRGHHGLDASNSYSDGEFVGKIVSSFALSPEDISLLQDSSPIIYARAKLGYDTYTSETYKILNSENFHVMWTENEIPKYGSIRYFAKCKSGDVVVIRLFKVDHTSVFYHKRTLKCIEHLIPIHSSNDCVAVRFEDIASRIVKVGKIDQYIYRRPHLYRFVL